MKNIRLTLTLLLGITLCYNSFALVTPTFVDSIPMRDGKKLAADIYIPSNCTSCPVILIQTPYNRLLFHFGLPLGVGSLLDSSKYVFVIADWRGFYGSASAAVVQPNRGEDGYDLIDWIALQSWCNGKVGTWGPSALGVIQFQTAKEQHPNHTCAIPLVAAPQTSYTEYFPGGAYRTEYVQQLDLLGYGLSTFLLANPFHTIAWTFVENSTNYPTDITIPTLMIGGWYDHNTVTMLDFFNALKAQSPAANEIKLLMGPWAHGGNGTAYVGSANQGQLTYPGAAGWNDSLSNLFFDYHLRNVGNPPSAWPNVTYFQMGDDQWLSSPNWPPAGVSNVNLYLHSTAIMGPSMPALASSFSAYAYDPRDPSPTIGGPTLRSDLDQGPFDQSPQVESRNDILIFSTPMQTSPVMMKGRGVAHLFVSSDKKDSDFSVRLTDVYPDGRSMLLCDGIRRARFANGYTTADTASLTAGQIVEMVIDLPHTSHTFLPGHRIRLDITSSNYPRFDCNLNNGGSMYVAGDTLIASNRIYHEATHASYITLPLSAVPVGLHPETTALLAMTISPNPAENSLFIKSERHSQANVLIYDMTGKLFFHGTMNRELTIDISSWSSGEYVVQYEEKNISQTEKFIKK